ncbi:MAG TPA: GntR family transcriptional regulator [Amycolatopsis sp.]|nr:GntR family transcriptional regulator [Amycolatopsis sp.]
MPDSRISASSPPPPRTGTHAPAHAAERAYHYTKERILRGDLAGGELVSEGQIGGMLGVSRTPVHEAFLRLDAEHLLTLSSRKGAVVAPMSPQESRDVLEMREAIESASARRLLARGRPPKEALAALRFALDHQRDAVAADDIDAFVEADDEFHSVVVRWSGNTLAAHFFAAIRDRQQRLRYQLLSIRSEHLTAALEDHRELAERVAAADPEGYAAVLHQHVARHQGGL